MLYCPRMDAHTESDAAHSLPIRTTIFLRRADRLSLVEYGNGTFGILLNGAPVGTPWLDLRECVDVYRRVMRTEWGAEPSQSHPA